MPRAAWKKPEPGRRLYSEGLHQDVLAQLTEGLSWASGWTEVYTRHVGRRCLVRESLVAADTVKSCFTRLARPVSSAALNRA